MHSTPDISTIISIRGDGNCGYRSLSMSLTGSQNNHLDFREDLMNYFGEQVKLYRQGFDDTDWWSKLYII